MRLLIAAVLVVASGCFNEPQVTLRPYAPAERPTVVEELGVLSYRVEIYAVSELDSELVLFNSYEVARGERLVTDSLVDGLWQVAVQGIDVTGQAVAGGRSFPFEVQGGESIEVPFLLGASHDFNSVELEPADWAAELSVLKGHTADLFQTVDGTYKILVAGGDAGSGSQKNAYVIDPFTRVIEQRLRMPCGRTQHETVRLQTSDGERIVLFGGAIDCGQQIAMFDPRDLSFQSVPIPCGSPSLEIAPELDGVDGVTPTGRLKVYSGTSCAFDPLTGLSDALEQSGLVQTSSSSYHPEGSGVLLIVDDPLSRRETLVMESAVDGADCFNESEGEWDELVSTSRADGIGVRGLLPLENGIFLLITDNPFLPLSQQNNFWLVYGGGCSLDKIDVGRRPSASSTPSSGVSLIDLTGENQPHVVVAGGTGDSGIARTNVYYLHVPTGGLPSMHVSETAARLFVPRTDAATVRLPTGDEWIIGGATEVGYPVESFVREGDPVSFSVADLELRSTAITTVVAADNASGLGPLHAAAREGILDVTFDTDVIEKASKRRFLIASSDRGIGDSLIENYDLVEEGECADIESDTPVTPQGVLLGDYQDLESSGGVEVVPTISPALNPLDDAVDEAEIRYDNVTTTFTNCSWRQTVRTGRDLLDFYLGSTDDPLEPYTGIKVLITTAGGDDCSQGVWTARGGVPDLTVPVGCVEEPFDDYFGFPPDPSEAAAFLSQAIWDPEDLIWAVIGHADSGSGVPRGSTCTVNGWTDFELVWKLGQVAEDVSSAEDSVFPVDICDEKSDAEEAEAVAALELGLAKIHSAVTERTFYQGCIPVEFAPQPPALGDYGGQPLYLPVSDNADGAVAVEASVASDCKVVVSPETVVDNVVEEIVEASNLDFGEGFKWSVGVYPLVTTCGSGWQVRVGRSGQQAVPGEESTIGVERASLVCID